MRKFALSFSILLLSLISSSYAQQVTTTATSTTSTSAPTTITTEPIPVTVITPPIPTTVTTVPAPTTVTTVPAPTTITTVPAPTTVTTGPAPSTTTVTTAPVPATRISTTTSQQFEDWLQKNGYTQQKVTTTTTTPTHTVTQTTTKRVPKKRSFAPITFEESQQVMLDTAPPNPKPTPDQVTAFNALLEQNMPMAPRQIVQLRQQIDVSQRAAAVPPNIPPKPVSSTLMINLAPGTTPPAVRLAQGYVTSLVFVDSTGSPWPIAAFDIGNPKAVTIQWDRVSNILLIQAVLPYSYGDIVVRLVGLPTPITLELVSGQRVVDYRVDVHVSGIGPNTKDLPVGTTLPESANQLLLGVLDGVAPAGSKLLMVSGAENQAWLLGEKMYLRTRMTVLSPGWIGKMVSPDGMQAYELPKTSSVLVSRYGEPVELRVEGY